MPSFNRISFNTLTKLFSQAGVKACLPVYLTIAHFKCSVNGNTFTCITKQNIPTIYSGRIKTAALSKRSGGDVRGRETIL